MIKVVFLTTLIVSTCAAVFAQEKPREFYAAFDVLRLSPTYYDRGFTIEPSLMYSIGHGLKLDAAFGISKIAKDDLFTNIDYSCSGNYVRLGVRKELGSDFDFGLSLGYSYYKESGSTTFLGKNFGDYTLEESTVERILFMEPTLNYKVEIIPRLLLIPQVRISLPLTAFSKKGFPAYTAPGIGLVKVESIEYFFQCFSLRIAYKIH